MPELFFRKTRNCNSMARYPTYLRQRHADLCNSAPCAKPHYVRLRYVIITRAVLSSTDTSFDVDFSLTRRMLSRILWSPYLIQFAEQYTRMTRRMTRSPFTANFSAFSIEHRRSVALRRSPQILRTESGDLSRRESNRPCVLATRFHFLTLSINARAIICGARATCARYGYK